jgi:outer membrane protein assembly factor BamB
MMTRRAICFEPIVMLAILLFACAEFPPAAAQLLQLPQVVRGDAAPVELTPPQLPVVSGTAAARLQQLPALIADGNWDDAIDTLNDVVQAEPSRVVTVSDNLYVSIRSFRQREIARWPAAGLAHYRSRVDALAERRYRDALAARDELALTQVVDDALCSSWGDDALFALGELALERADYAAARRAWSRLLPATAPQSAAVHYPDTNLDPAAIRARLVLVSIRENDLPRADLDLANLLRLHPNAAGRLGGKETQIVPALETLLASARNWPTPPTADDWPTFAGAMDRQRVLPAIGAITLPAWNMPVRLPRMIHERAVPAFLVGARPESERLEVDSPQRLYPVAAYFPVTADGRIYYSDGASVRAVNLADGSLAITSDGLVYRTDAAPQIAASGSRGVGIGDMPRFTLSVVGDTLYARVGPDVTAGVAGRETTPGARIVGLSLQREGLLTFSASPPDKSWAFDGVPVGDARRLFVALRRSDVNPQAAVACFDAAIGRELWRTPVGSANTTVSGRADEITHNLLTLAGDRVYFGSNLGFVASLRTSDGAIEWLRTYPRGRTAEAKVPNLPFQSGHPLNRPPSPALYHRGVLFLSPLDTAIVLAIDTDSGSELWINKVLSAAVYELGHCHLLGVVDGHLVCAGLGLHFLDIHTGSERFGWPLADRDVAAPAVGRGLIAGHEVFCPTAKEIHVLDARTGKPSRPPISLAPVGSQGAN